MKVQRLRVTFARGEEMKYITHLDLMRFWERALRRAGLPVAYSEGFTPHPQISLAAPLPVGTTSDAELMDVFLTERVAPREFLAQAGAQVPAGIRVVSAEEVGLALPSVQADVRFAEYDVIVVGADRDDAERKIDSFLAAASVPWEHRRQEELRSYDIRALVESIEIISESDGELGLRMRVRSDSSGSGRPEQVVAALGLATLRRVHRTRLVLAGTSPAREAYRRRGRFAS
jgi:radical SAM-linked protein